MAPTKRGTRKVGKTKAVCDIISATRQLSWTAVKLTSHAHGMHGPSPDTDRYLVAGAQSAMLLHPDDDLPAASSLIVESNAVLARLTPDLFVFVTDSSNTEWKQSARDVIDRADIVVDREISAARLAEIAQRVTAKSQT